MSISVIIAHYAPPRNTQIYLNLLKNTIRSVRNQKVNFDIEIILCDDGSTWSKKIWANNEDKMIEFNRKTIKKNQLLNKLGIDLYLALPDVNKYRGTTLKHRAFELAKYEKIVVLDDDHPLINKDSLFLYNIYLDKYEFVRGRVVGPWGRPQLFLSKNAQGTNYGLRKELYFRISGFGKYLFENGYGEDNDILWKIYSELSRSKTKKACWAGEIITKDLATNRWADRVENGIYKYENILTQQNKRYTNFVKDFKKENGVHPFYKNNSRNKILWFKFASISSFISEIKHTIIYLKYIPLIWENKLNKIKKGGKTFLKFKVKTLLEWLRA